MFLRTFFANVLWSMIQSTMGYENVGYIYCALRNELQEKLRAAGIDHGRSIRDLLAMLNMVTLGLIFEYSKDMGFCQKY
jgi:hypothetical protein